MRFCCRVTRNGNFTWESCTFKCSGHQFICTRSVKVAQLSSAIQKLQINHRCVSYNFEVSQLFACAMPVLRSVCRFHEKKMNKNEHRLCMELTFVLIFATNIEHWAYFMLSFFTNIPNFFPLYAIRRYIDNNAHRCTHRIPYVTLFSL